MTYLTEIKKQAIRYLGYREHTAGELRKKLELKFGDLKCLSGVIETLIDEGLLSDFRYTIMYIESRAKKGYGKRYIQNSLKEKGVSEEIVTQGFVECSIDWSIVMRKLCEKKFASNDVSSDLKEKSRQARFLLNRGFSSYDINRELNNMR